MVIFEIFYRQNLIQLYTKMYHLKKISLVNMPPNPPSKLPNLKKIFLAPPLPNPGDAPAVLVTIDRHIYIIMQYYIML